jgi:integrase/predicted transcriptional regulator
MESVRKMVGRKPQEHNYDQTIIDFLNSQKESTRNIYKCNFQYILNFTGMTGKEILESKRNDKDFLWEKKAVELRQWAKAKGVSDSTAKSAVAILRSFFVYYRTPLVFTRAEINKVGAKGQRTTKDYVLTNEDIAKLVFVADLREKYIVLGGKSFGLRSIDFIKFTYGTFRGINLNQEAPISIGEIGTIKEGVPAYPFIDSDLVPTLKAMLEAGATHANNEQILTFDETELTTVLQRLAEKANLQLGDKHLRFHCFRKYLIDRLSTLMSDQKWKQIVGKSLSEGAYVSPLELRESYAKVMKLTTVLNGNGNGKVNKIAEELRAEIATLKKHIDKIESENLVTKLTFEQFLTMLKDAKVIPRNYQLADIEHDLDKKAEETEEQTEEEETEPKYMGTSA